MNDAKERTREPSSALILRGSDAPELGDEVRLQHLWLNLQQRSWRLLAVMAASEGVETLATADALAKIAWWFTGRPACVMDMRDLSLRLLEHQIRAMAAQLEGGERIFIPLRAMSENPTAIPLAMAADAVVLCVELGKTRIKDAQRALRAVGREKFIGSILVAPRSRRAIVTKPAAAQPGPDIEPGPEVEPGESRE